MINNHPGDCDNDRLLQKCPALQIMGPVIQARGGSDFYSTAMRKVTNSGKRGFSHTWSCVASEVILDNPQIDENNEEALVEDEAKNGEAYAELVQCLDNKSLSLIMRDAKRDGRRALEILREHYAGKDKPRVVSLYCELSSLQKGSQET